MKSTRSLTSDSKPKGEYDLTLGARPKRNSVIVVDVRGCRAVERLFSDNRGGILEGPYEVVDVAQIEETATVRVAAYEVGRFGGTQLRFLRKNDKRRGTHERGGRACT